MIVGFRVDASFQIGTGHLMRCLTLADSLSARGAKVIFLCRDLPEYLREILATKKYPLLDLGHCGGGEIANSMDGEPLPHASWLSVSQSVDAESSLRALGGLRVDWLVVDHYALDANWERRLRPHAKSVLVIDDLADRNHDCDALLDQNFYPAMRERYAGKTPDSCVMLLGPKYSLLREEFRLWRAKVTIRDSGIRRALVFFGGVDASNYTGQLVNALPARVFEKLSLDVVVGAGHPRLAEIQAQCDKKKLSLHIQTGRMAELMAKSDIAIGAGGATSWERCCLGLPAITVSLADNQTDIAKGLQSIGASIFLGESLVVDPRCVTDELASLADRPGILRSMSKCAFDLVDGEGADRVIDVMCR